MGRPRKKFEEVKKIFESRGYYLLENECLGAHQLLNYTCLKHPDKKLKSAWYNIMRGHGCPYCANERVKHSYDNIKQVFCEKGYTLLSENYIKAGLLLEYICNKHPDKIRKITYNNLLNGHGCAQCAGNVKFTIEKVNQMFLEKEYELLETEYINNHTLMQYICKKHPSCIRKITVDNLRAGKECPDCWGGRNSKLSKKVEDKLISNGIIFLKEYRFKDCKLEITLAFDFYLPHYNICIEVDGQQHYKPVTFGGISKYKAQKEFEKTIKRDNVKNNYCKNNGINLIRIPYFFTEKVDKIINDIKRSTR